MERTHEKVFFLFWMGSRIKFFSTPLFLQISGKCRSQCTPCKEWSKILWSPFVPLSLAAVGGWIRTKTLDRTPYHSAWIKVTTVQGHNNLVLSGKQTPSLKSCGEFFFLAFDTFRFNLWFCVSHPHNWSPSAAASSHRDRGEVPSQHAKLVTLGWFPDRSACFLPKILSFSFPSLPLAIPLSSCAQVGKESGTSRRRRLMLYTGANYPLLDGRKGRDEKRVGKGGRKDGGKTEICFYTTRRGKLRN